jgi:hypothetical protein
MDTKDLITLIQLQNGAVIVKGKYLTPRAAKQGGLPGQSAPTSLNNEYHFKDILGLGLRVGDMVVVETLDTYSLVKLTEVRCLPSNVGCILGDLKRVVSVVDLTAMTRAIVAENESAYDLSLSEVTSRLQTFKTQVGESLFNSVAANLRVGSMPPPRPSPMLAGQVIEDYPDAI